MRKIAGILLAGASLALPSLARAQASKFFPSGSLPMNKTELLKIYSGIESQTPRWKKEAEAMQPRPAFGPMARVTTQVTREDLLKTLSDLGMTVHEAKYEDFGNQWDVAFIECRVKDDLDEVEESFDSYSSALAASPGSLSQTEYDRILMQQMIDVRTYGTDSRLLRMDLENRLHNMAVLTEK